MGEEKAEGSSGPRNRLWLPPLIANLAALAVLFVLMIPGVLRFPSFPDASQASKLEEERLHETNDNLDKQLQALQTKLAALTCRAPDSPSELPDAKSGNKITGGDQK